MPGLPGFDGDVQLPNWTQINALFNPDANAQRAAEAVQAQNKAQSGTQDLADRATLRERASGFATMDPSAIGTALSVPVGVASVNALGEYAGKIAALRNGMISIGGVPVGGGNPLSPTGAQNPTTGAGQSVTPTSEAPGPGQSLLVGDTPVHADQAAQQQVGQVAQEEGVNPEWAKRVAYAESGTNINSMAARSRSGAVGTMQLMPGTAAGLQVDPTVPEQNWRGGVQYLKQMKEMFNDPVIATAAYNAGPGKVSKWLAGQAQLPAETVAYVGRVFGTGDGSTLLSRALAGAHGHAVPGVQISSLNGTVETPPAAQAPAGMQVASNAPVALPVAQTDEATAVPAAPDASATVPATAGAVHTLLDRYRNAQLPPEQQVAMDPSYQANRDAPVPGQTAVPAAPAVAPAAAPTLRPAAQSAPAPMPQQATPAPAQPAPAQPQAGVQTLPRADYPPPGTTYFKTGPGQVQFVPSGTAGYVLAQFPDGTTGPARPPGMAGPELKIEKTANALMGLHPTTGQVISSVPIAETGRMVFHDAPGGSQGFINGHKVGELIPFSGRDAQLAAYKEDQDKAKAMTVAANEAQATMPRLNEMADIAKTLATGPTAEIRAKAQAFLETIGIPQDRAASVTGISSAAVAQEFMKLALSTSGSAAKADLGSNNGVQSVQIYQNANPNMNLLPDANTRITNMLRVAMQAKQDYAVQGLQHFGEQENRISGTDGHGSKPYTSLTAFDRSWLSQNNPQVYAAATGILNGDPYTKWADRLHDPALAHRAVEIAARVDPNVRVPVAGAKMRPAHEILGSQ